MEESSVNEEKIISIEIERLKDFKDHPFRVRSDRDMQKLLASIKQYGILSPLIVRPIPEGVYEIISGHRRKYAAQQLGYRKVPVIIRAMKDDEAVISMIDANLQREQIRPSEKAFAYKMKYDAIKRRSGRRKKDAIDYHFKGKRSVNGNEYRGRVYTGIDQTNANSVDNCKWKDQKLSINTVRIAEGDVIAPKNCTYWFYGCSNMTSCDLTSLDTGDV